MRKRLWLGVVTFAALMVALAGVALAHPEHDGGTDAQDGAHDLHQHGDASGHLPATDENVDAFLNEIVDDTKRADSKRIRALMESASGEQAMMWYPGIIGFGNLHYR